MSTVVGQNQGSCLWDGVGGFSFLLTMDTEGWSEEDTGIDWDIGQHHPLLHEASDRLPV